MQLQKISALRYLFIYKAPLLCANHIFLINHAHKPQRKNFQLSEVEIQQSSELFELL